MELEINARYLWFQSYMLCVLKLFIEEETAHQPGTKCEKLISVLFNSHDKLMSEPILLS